VVGDTVNIASRIEALSRRVGAAVAASDEIIRRAVAETGREAVSDFYDLGEHAVRGRQAMIRLWGLSAESQTP
jgi:adenylate cyclase